MDRPEKSHISERIYLDMQVHPPELVYLTYRGIQREDYERNMKEVRSQRDLYLFTAFILGLLLLFILPITGSMYAENKELRLETEKYRGVK